MPDESMIRRIDLATKLLSELKKLQQQLSELFSEMEKSTASLYEQLLREEKGAIGEDTDQYQANLEKCNRLNYLMMEKINSWYDFVKDPGERTKVLFPVQFYLNRRKLKRDIKAINREIGRLTIENRFFREKVSDWEYGLEQETIRKTKLGSQYKGYEQLQRKKNELIHHVKYLFFTLPLSYPVRLDLRDIDGLIKTLETKKDEFV